MQAMFSDGGSTGGECYLRLRVKLSRPLHKGGCASGDIMQPHGRTEVQKGSRKRVCVERVGYELVLPATTGLQGLVGCPQGRQPSQLALSGSDIVVFLSLYDMKLLASSKAVVLLKLYRLIEVSWFEPQRSLQNVAVIV